jgi:hypothetical protein
MGLAGARIRTFQYGGISTTVGVCADDLDAKVPE